MLQAAYIGAAILIGIGFATQISLISAMGRLRGPLEATWVSLLATIAVFALIMAVRSSQGGALALPPPFERPVVFIAVAALSALGLALAMKGIATYFVVTGLFAIPLLVGAGFFGPRIGIGLYIGSVIAGQLAGSVFLDHIGAFGIPVHRVDAIRAAGVVSLLLGVALIRGIR